MPALAKYKAAFRLTVNQLEGICSYLKIRSFIAEVFAIISAAYNISPGIRKIDPMTIAVIEKPLALLLYRPAFILFRSILPQMIAVKGKPIVSIKTIISLSKSVGKLTTLKGKDALKTSGIDITLRSPITKAVIDKPLNFSGLVLSFI